MSQQSSTSPGSSYPHSNSNTSPASTQRQTRSQQPIGTRSQQPNNPLVPVSLALAILQQEEIYGHPVLKQAVSRIHTLEAQNHDLEVARWHLRQQLDSMVHANRQSPSNHDDELSALIEMVEPQVKQEQANGVSSSSFMDTFISGISAPAQMQQRTPSTPDYHRIFHTNLSAMYVIDMTTMRIVDCNSQFEALTGYARSDVMGQVWTATDLAADDERAQYQEVQLLVAVHEAEQRIPARAVGTMRTKDGKHLRVAVVRWLVPDQASDGGYFRVHVIEPLGDISDTTSSSTASKSTAGDSTHARQPNSTSSSSSSSDHLPTLPPLPRAPSIVNHHDLFEQAAMPLEVLDLATFRIVDANAAFLHLTGYTKGELLSLDRGIFSLTAPRSHQQVLQTLRTLVDNQQRGQGRALRCTRYLTDRRGAEIKCSYIVWLSNHGQSTPHRIGGIEQVWDAETQ